MKEPLESTVEALCLRCGRCCKDPFSRYVSPDDVPRWQDEKRADILAALDEEQRYLEEESGFAGLRRFKPCRYNKPDGDDGRTLCLIYRTRPQVCREFTPGRSRLCSAKK